MYQLEETTPEGETFNNPIVTPITLWF